MGTPPTKASTHQSTTNRREPSSPAIRASKIRHHLTGILMFLYTNVAPEKTVKRSIPTKYVILRGFVPFATHRRQVFCSNGPGIEQDKSNSAVFAAAVRP